MFNNNYVKLKRSKIMFQVNKSSGTYVTAFDRLAARPKLIKKIFNKIICLYGCFNKFIYYICYICDKPGVY